MRVGTCIVFSLGCLCASAMLLQPKRPAWSTRRSRQKISSGYEPGETWIDIAYDEQNGSSLQYSIVADGLSYVAHSKLQPVAWFVRGSWYSPADTAYPLVLTNSTGGIYNNTIIDFMGNFTELEWAAGDPARSKARLVTRFMQYFEPRMAARFDWRIEGSDADNTLVGLKAREPSVRFPVFSGCGTSQAGSAQSTTLLWHGTFSQANPVRGFPNQGIPSARQGHDPGGEIERGPIVLASDPYDPDPPFEHPAPGSALVLGPLQHLLDTTWAIVNITAPGANPNDGDDDFKACSDTHDYAWVTGPSGRLTSLPQGYQGGIIAMSEAGTTRALASWAELARKYNTMLPIPDGVPGDPYQYHYDGASTTSQGVKQHLGAEPTLPMLPRIGDLALMMLSTYTDNGAALGRAIYPPLPDKTPADLLLEIQKWYAQNDVPSRATQLDDWWSVNVEGFLCVKEWTGNPKYFPDGVPALFESLKYLGSPGLVLYAGCFSKQLDLFESGDYSVYPSFDDTYHNPAPSESKRFFGYIMKSIKDNFGGTNFETDFMLENLDETPGISNVTGTAAEWFHGMYGAGAAAAVPTQICMANPGQIMETMRLPGVTNGRASNDYACEGGNSTNEWDNFEIGQSGLLFYAVGLPPSKDVTWTTADQVGVPAQCGNEHNHSSVEMTVAIAALSTGPVGIGDAPFLTNASLARMAARSDGVLLKPDKPLTAVDSTYYTVGIGKPGLPTAPENGKCRFHPCPAALWQTHSYIPPSGDSKDAAAEPAEARYFVSVNVGSFELDAPDFYPMLPEGSVYAVQEARTAAGKCRDGDDANESGCIMWHAAVANNSLSKAPDVTTGRSRVEGDPARGMYAWRLFRFFRKFSNGWILLGELDKWVPLAKQRFRSVAAETTKYKACLSVEIVGASGETIAITAVDPNNRVVVKSVKLPGDRKSLPELGRTITDYGPGKDASAVAHFCEG